MKIIDVHAHYNDEVYVENFEDNLNKMKSKGVKYILNTSYDISSSKKSIEYAKKYKEFYAIIGIHPENVNEINKVDEIEELYNQNKDGEKIVAIGEIGLDYHYTDDNKEQQIELFKKQIEIANKLNLPIVIHSRDAAVDLLVVLKSIELPKKIMFHCFDLNEEVARFVIKNGYSISVGGNITYKRKDSVINVLKQIPLSLIMTETDSPYLSPEPYRGKINNSANIEEIIKKLAEIKEISVAEVEKQVYENAIKFFEIEK